MTTPDAIHVVGLTKSFGDLEEAEQLAQRISILHGGRVVVDGTLAELRALLPPAEVRYVERRPSLEDVFLAVVGAGTGEAR